MSNNTPVYVGSQVIGHVTGDVFYKRVSRARHFLRQPVAIAFDVSSLRAAEAAGARHVCVTDTDSGKEYRVPMSVIWDKGFTFNRGHGRQIGVPIGEWNRRPEPAQLSLFGGAR